MAGLFTRNRPAGAPVRTGLTPRIPSPGETAQEASAVYTDFYGEMPIPATQFVTSTARLRSLDVQPMVRTAMSNASVVSRADRRNGIINTGGRQMDKSETPEYNKPVYSSEFQEWLIGPQVNYTINAGWYIAYPAATISLGTNRNLGLSERVPQLVTRYTGGPGPSAMMPAPKFQAVQRVPRYSTMPPFYNTQATGG